MSMNPKHFINALDNYIGNDQMQSAIKLIEKATSLDTSIVISVMAIVEDNLNNDLRNHNFLGTFKQPRPTLGHLIYTKLTTDNKSYPLTSSAIKYKIKTFRFKPNFERI